MYSGRKKKKHQGYLHERGILPRTNRRCSKILKEELAYLTLPLQTLCEDRIHCLSGSCFFCEGWAQQGGKIQVSPNDIVISEMCELRWCVWDVLCVMDEYSLDLHSFPMVITFDWEHQGLTRLIKTQNSVREVIIMFICSSACCGGYHKALRQSGVKHNICECFKL